jgi:HPt (histidine-containing phosphotransfer) domain-containing protein
MDDADWHQVGTIAHSVKGSAGSFGYPQLTKCATTLEYSAKQSSANEIKHQLKMFEQICEAIITNKNKPEKLDSVINE